MKRRLMSSQRGDVITVVPLFGGQGAIKVNSWLPDSKSFAFVHYHILGDEMEQITAKAVNFKQNRID